MVNDRLHIICGNCGQDLKESGMATWEYVPAEINEEDGEILNRQRYIYIAKIAQLYIV